MFETEAELDALQSMFDAHLERANAHMLGIVTPSRRLTARQVATYLIGTKHVAFATVTRNGEPRVSPLDSLFIHGRFTMSTGGDSTRIAHLRRNPACSAVHMDGDRVAIVANGTVEWIGRDHPDHDEIHGAWTAEYGNDPYTWGDEIVFFRLRPASMWAYASNPEAFSSAGPALSNLAAEAGAAPGVESAVVFVRRPGSDELARAAAVGIGGAALANLEVAVRNPAHPVARALHDSSPTYDVTPMNPGGPALRSHLPLDGLGVLAVSHDEPLTPEGRARLEGVADAVIRAIRAGEAERLGEA